MSASHFDVIILGISAAPLTCGALLAKRGFRVLVVGQGEPPAAYQLGPYRLPQRLGGHPVNAKSPVAQRVLSELGLSQSFRRMTMTGGGTAFQVAMPGHRFDITADSDLFARELEREFPEVKRPIEDFHAQAERLSEQLDRMFELDLVWPPSTFFERRALARAHARSGLSRREESDSLAEFPEDHPFRQVTQAPVYFETGAARTPGFGLGSVRLYHNRLSRHAWLQGGAHAFQEMLLDRIRSHSGQVLLDDRVREIVVRRGRAQGVRLFGSNEEISSNFVIAGIGVGAMLNLVPDRHVFEELFERHGEPQVRHYRFLLNVVLPKRAIPAGMGRSLYAFDSEGLEASGEHALLIERQDHDDKHTVVTAEALLPAALVEGQSRFLETARERIGATLGEVLPFVDRHALAVDSPHDGRPPDLRVEMPFKAAQSARGPRTLPATYSFPGAQALGLCALPIRGPIRNLLLCNGQVVPTLGAEGELLTACSAARVVAVADRSKNWMRHRRWSKLEL